MNQQELFQGQVQQEQPDIRQPLQNVNIESQMAAFMNQQGYGNDLGSIFQNANPIQENQNPQQHLAPVPFAAPSNGIAPQGYVAPQMPQQAQPQSQPMPSMQSMPQSQPMQPMPQQMPQMGQPVPGFQYVQPSAQPQVPQNPEMVRLLEQMSLQNQQMQQMMQTLKAREIPEQKIPDFISPNTDMDNVLATPENFNKVLQSVYARALQDVQTTYGEDMRQQLTAQLYSRMEAQNALNDFFAVHPEMRDRRDLVGVAIQTVRQREPETVNATQILQKVEQMLSIAPRQQQYTQQAYGQQGQYISPQPVPQNMGFAQPLGGISTASPYVGVPNAGDTNKATLEMMAEHLFGRG